MAIGLRVDDRLNGAVNFGAWKEKMTLLLQESELWDIVENSTTNPVNVPTNATLLATYTKNYPRCHQGPFDSSCDGEGKCL